MAPLARLVVLAAVVACALAQYAEERAPRYIASESKATTPVPILKQINRHNEDGSYTYGYEAADGSFKIETKSTGGDVKGKYGYKDETGKLRVIEYGANKYGFQPAGEGITVAPPTLVDESTREPKTQGGRSQYNSPDYDYEEPAPAPAPRARPAPQPRPQPQQQQYRPQPQAQQQQYRPQQQPQQQPQPQQQYRPAPQPQQQPQQYRPPPQPQQQYRAQPQQRPQPQHSAPSPPKPQFFAGAAPSPIEDNFFNPEPAPRQYKPKQEFRPAPQIQEFGSDDFGSSQQRYQPSQVPQQRNTQTYSMLDQLLKEYSLPQGGSAPLHDISFGSY